MKFYQPQFKIATLELPQRQFVSKFGGLPWGLPIEHWRRCQDCGRLMSLLAQLQHDPPALDLGSSEYVLHLFQCQECYGFDTGHGNDAVMVPVHVLGEGLTQLPADEDVRGVLGSNLDQMVGELWINGWKEEDDGLDHSLLIDFFDLKKWRSLPKSILHSMYENGWRTKMGGLPYWTGHGPQHTPLPGYEFLFQLDCPEFEGLPPNPNEVGCNIITTQLSDEGASLRIKKQSVVEPMAENKKTNAPWCIVVGASQKNRFIVDITNLGSDGTAYIFINRNTNPAGIYWFWNR